MIYGYARVSTITQAKDGNSLEAQEKMLQENGAINIYKDSFSGAKNNRPQLELLLSVIQKDDTLVVTKLDRVARSCQNGIELINGLLSKGVNIHILNIGYLDSSPSSKLIQNIFLHLQSLKGR